MSDADTLWVNYEQEKETDHQFLSNMSEVNLDELFQQPIAHDAVESLPAKIKRPLHDNAQVAPTCSPLKSRLACISFSPEKYQLVDRQACVDLLGYFMSMLDETHRRVHGSFGMPLRFGTFFTLDNQPWFVFVSRDAQTFHKWHQVCAALEASQIKILHRKSDNVHHLKNSMNCVLDMFPRVSLQELFQNQRAASIQQLEAETADLNLSSSRKKRRLSKKSARDEEAKSPCTPQRPQPSLNQMDQQGLDQRPSAAKHLDWASLFASQPDNAVIPALALPVQSSADDVVARCVDFLGCASLDTCPQHEATLRFFLVGSEHQGRMGIFLLDGRQNELYHQAAYLQELVYAILGDRFDLRPPTLSSADLRSCPAYPLADQALRDALAPISDLHDSLATAVTFALHDRVSVLVFLSVCLLRNHRDHRMQRPNTDFLANEAAVLGEVPWVYSKMVHAMQAFVATQQACAPQDFYWLPPAGASHMSILEAHATELPVEFVIRTGPDASRCAYRINKFSGLMAEIQRHFRVAQNGMPVAVWKDVQALKTQLQRVRASDQTFLLLPSTRYSLNPQSHSTSYEDTLQLVAVLKGAAQPAAGTHSPSWKST